MVFLVLLGCWPFAGGAYDLVVSSESSDCAEPPPIQLGRVYLERENETLRIHPLPDPCSTDGERFSCELSAFDQSADAAEAGIDAVVTIDMDLAGVFDGGALVGTASWVTACAGRDCDDVEAVSPEFCSTTWTWTGEQR